MTLNNLRLLGDPLLLRHSPASGFTHWGWSQAQKIICKNPQCTDARCEDKQDKQGSLPKKQKQHPTIFIPEQAQAVTEPTAVYYNCISQWSRTAREQYRAVQNRKCSWSTAAIWAIFNEWPSWRLSAIIYIFPWTQIRKEGCVCVFCYIDLHEWQPLSEWCLGMCRKNNTTFFNHYCTGVNSSLSAGVKASSDLRGSDDDITLALIKYLHHSSDSWRPRVRPSVCPPSRSAHRGPQMTPWRSAWRRTTGKRI